MKTKLIFSFTKSETKTKKIETSFFFVQKFHDFVVQSTNLLVTSRLSPFSFVTRIARDDLYNKNTKFLNKTRSFHFSFRDNFLNKENNSQFYFSYIQFMYTTFCFMRFEKCTSGYLKTFYVTF